MHFPSGEPRQGCVTLGWGVKGAASAAVTFRVTNDPALACAGARQGGLFEVAMAVGAGCEAAGLSSANAWPTQF